jgi:transcriptional regulator GlxA family with amidase domain
MPGYSALFHLEPTFRSMHQFSSRLQLNREDLGAAEALAERIERESAQAQPGHEAVLLGLLLELMVLLSRRYGESDVRESRALLQMGRLISTLEQRYQEPWTLEQLARFTHLSRTSLLLVFRQATGKSPIDYLIGLRLEAAKRLLRHSELGMTEIALETGFGDSNYFARKFRAMTGRTPTAFRRAGRVG